MAAITEMSLVDIVSRPKGQEHVYSTIFKVNIFLYDVTFDTLLRALSPNEFHCLIIQQGGEKLFCGPSSKYPRFSHGTTISVRDLFYKVHTSVLVQVLGITVIFGPQRCNLPLSTRRSFRSDNGTGLMHRHRSWRWN